MTSAELEEYRLNLLVLAGQLGISSGLAAEVLRGVGGGHGGSLSNTPLHLADLGTDTFEHEISVGLLENSAQILEQTRDALRRIPEGTYGKCQECGKEIAPKRLRAVPYTPYCLNCARQIQAEEELRTARNHY